LPAAVGHLASTSELSFHLPVSGALNCDNDSAHSPASSDSGANRSRRTELVLERPQPSSSPTIRPAVSSSFRRRLKTLCDMKSARCAKARNLYCAGTKFPQGPAAAEDIEQLIGRPDRKPRTGLPKGFGGGGVIRSRHRNQPGRRLPAPLTSGAAACKVRSRLSFRKPVRQGLKPDPSEAPKIGNGVIPAREHDELDNVSSGKRARIADQVGSDICSVA